MYKDRDSVRTLKTVGRDFLKLSSASAVVDIRLRSVRDFLESEERSLPQDPKIDLEDQVLTDPVRRTETIRLPT